MLAFSLLITGIISRLVIHVPNFTPVVALALFGGYYLNRKRAVLWPVLLMVASDLIIGLHGTIMFTWGSVALIALMGSFTKEKKSVKNVAGTLLVSAVLFFVITNFGAWLEMYPKTAAGLIECYVAAIPFFRNTLIATFVYGGALFGLYELIAKRVRQTKLEYILR